MTAAARPTRGRRTSRPTGDDREQAILATAERLLGARALRDISIDDLAKGAGISRPTFYFYFRSKEAVLLALLDRVVQEADAAATVLPDSQLAADPPHFWRAVIAAFYNTFREHRAVTLAAAEARCANEEVRALWSSVMATWTDRAATAIESERTRGAAPPGLPSRDLAVALSMMNERSMHTLLAGDQPALTEPDVITVLHTIWLNAIYQTTSPTASPTTSV
jgi:TetR/AcrR family transcriptional regulator, ethionamide resistance regulator